MIYSHMASPVGRLLLAGATADGALQLIGFSIGSMAHGPAPDWHYQADAFAAARTQLEEYFAGQRQDFDVPLDPRGTDFQQSVWTQLRGIPFGETCSYRDIAERLGKPKAVRAVGSANGRNPLPIIVPCHRVIGSNGSLTGFGGGLENKQILLELERNQARLF
ncbi:MAG: methylated-DNA--[protein]-cysteine S-methyltransferase [Pseudomonadales bacterium]